MYSENSVKDATRAFLSSSFFLFTISVTTLMTIIPIIGVIISVIFPQNDFIRLLKEFGFFGEGSVAGAEIISCILPFIPQLLILFGLWKTYLNCKSHKFNSTSGLTIIKIIQVIKTAFLCVVGLLVVGLCLFGIYSGKDIVKNEYFNSSFFIRMGDNLSGFFIFTTIIISILLVITLIYYTSIIRTINNAKNAIKGKYECMPSGFLIFANIIISAILILSLSLFFIVGLKTANSGQGLPAFILSFVFMLINASIPAMYSLLLISFGRKITKIMNEECCTEK